MKHFLLYFLLCANSFLLASQLDHFEVVQDRGDDICIQFNTPEFDMENIELKGVNYFQLLHQDANEYTKTGNPNIPSFSALVEIDERGHYDLEFEIKNDKSVYSGVLAPVQSHFNNERLNKDFYKNETLYQSKSIYPQNRVVMSKPKIMRNKRVVNITVYPVANNLRNKDILIADQVDIRIIKSRNAGENELTKKVSPSSAFQNIYKSMILNNKVDRVLPFEAKTILMIYNPDDDEGYNDKLNDYVVSKKKRGYRVYTASTTETGTSTNSIKNYIENAYATWEFAPDYIILLGDAEGSYTIQTFIESMSNYGGEGDYPYVMLAGDDELPDAFIGRISFDSIIQFKTIVNKIIKYETLDPYMDYSWMDKVLLVGSTASGTGVSAWFTNRYISELMEDFKPDYYSFDVQEAVNSNPQLVNESLNQGRLFYNYRGFIGMDGWNDDLINSLANDFMPVNATILTCSTNSFASGESKVEKFVRVGTVGTPKGAVGAIGLSTPGTHTTFNNCLVGGMYTGLFVDDLTTMGEALVRGQLHLYQCYGNSNPVEAYIFAHWCNLIGDPSLNVWKQIPESMQVSHQFSIVEGTNFIDITVTDGDNVALKNAVATIYDEETDTQFTTRTDNDGFARLMIDAAVSDAFTLTVNSDQKMPYQTDINVTQGNTIEFDAIEITDDDGQINPAQDIDLNFSIVNNTGIAFNNVEAVITSTNDLVQVNSTSVTMSNAQNNEIATSLEPINISIDGSILDQEMVNLTATIELNDEAYHCGIPLEIFAPTLQVNDVQIYDSNDNVLNAGETANISLIIQNIGRQNIQNGELIIRSLDTRLVVNDSIVSVSNFNTEEPTQTPYFNVLATSLIVPGLRIPMQSIFVNEQGLETKSTFTITCGAPEITNLTGPDAYGYVCYDDGDEAANAPTYNWLDISDTTPLPLSDNGNNEDDVTTIDLPFLFRFYGEEYNQISVCSNGWISFGETTQATFRNWRMPGPLGPSAMIAAFWDDLVIGNGHVYAAEVPDENAFVIQWDNMKNYYNQSYNETFQIVLYNPFEVTTTTGDGKIKIQYEVVNNIDQGTESTHGNYATVGIEDHTQTIGLEYTFNNEYLGTAKSLENEMAILFEPAPQSANSANLIYGSTNLVGSFASHFIVPGESADLSINLLNYGAEDAYNLSATLSSPSPFVTINQNQSDYPTIASLSAGTNINFFSIEVSETVPTGSILPFQLDIVSEAGLTWNQEIELHVGSNIAEIVNTGNVEKNGNGNSIIDPGEDCYFIYWIANPSQNAINLNCSLTASSAALSIVNTPQMNIEIPAKTTYQIFFDGELASTAPQEEIELEFSAISDEVESLSINTSFVPGLSNQTFDFEEDESGFTTDGVWERTSMSGAPSGNYLWVTAPNSDYPNNTDKSLVSPSILCTSNSTVQFTHMFNFESNFDGGCVEISVDGGSYNIVTPSGGYSSNTVHALDSAGYTGNGSYWETVSIDLSSYEGSEIQIRWRMASDGSITQAGWFIDDVVYSGLNSNISVVSGLVSLSDGADDTHIYVQDEDNITAKANDDGLFLFFTQNQENAFNISSLGYSNYETGMLNLEDAIEMVLDPVLLQKLSNPNTLSVEADDNLVTLNWDYSNENNETNNTGFNIYRKDGTSPFALISTTESMMFSETLPGNLYEYYVTAVYDSGESLPSNSESVAIGYVSEEVNAFAEELIGNYPNPFNPTTTIKFSVSRNDVVKIEVYNIRGQLVKSLVNSEFERGEHSIEWHGKNNANQIVSSGVYFIRMKTSKILSTKKVLLLK